jgi:hypothetical protein
MSSPSDSSPAGHTTTDPATLAGDPFAYAGDKGGSCFACYVGWVYLGELVEDPETGEEVEVFEAVPCRRCADSR